jgi:hypothetical protein
MLYASLFLVKLVHFVSLTMINLKSSVSTGYGYGMSRCLPSEALTMGITKA